MDSTILQILVTPITELAKLFVVPLKQQVVYLLKHHNNIEDLKTKTKDLELNVEATNHAIDAARRRGEVTTVDIEHWRTKAQLILTDVHKFLADFGEKESGNSKTGCTNLCRRYGSSKRAVKLAKVINEVKGSFQQIPVSRPAPPPGIEMMPMGEFEAFESTRVAMEKVIEALNCGDSHVIGVYGMGGVGKTSLIVQVAKYVKMESMFDEVVIATVSRNPDSRKIQREIAEGLGLQLMEKTEHIRSLRLSERMKHETRKLIILDDVWERLELSLIGIGYGEDKSHCKVAITTRNLDVCSEMSCDASIIVDPLSQKDARDLFKKVIGNVEDSQELDSYAEEFARECGGLPIALVTLGRALRNKEWKFCEDAAVELRQSRPLNIKGMHKNVFSCLKLSFDEFENEESKMCFLYYALFPEDNDVRIEDLLRYGIGERLFSDAMSLDEARNRVHSIISNLKASCLLLCSTNRECVKMHDVFRDLAISIATSNDYSFMVKASSGLKEWPSNFNLQYVMRMSLTNNNFSMFKGAGEYPELILLLLQNNPSLKSISNEFFAGMKPLQVLDLSNIPCLQKLPSSLSSLTNLRTLCLDNNRLQDGSVLGDLTSIEILSMRKSSFARFPEEIRRLTNLRLLDLTDSEDGEIPSKVFSSLSRLEELYMGGSFNDWELEKSNSSRKATLAEVLSLERLNILHIDIGYHGGLTEEIIHRQTRLKKFHLHIGERLHSRSTYATSMCLNIPGFFGVCNPFKIWLKSFINTAEHLFIASWKDRSCLEEFPIDSFQSLKSLHVQQCHIDICFSTALFDRFQALQELQIRSCHNLDTVFLSVDDHSPQNVLPRLTNLHIHDAPNLTSLWRGVAPSTGFQTLKYIKIENCMQMKTLFPLSVAKVLNHLQYLELSHCDVMEAVIGVNEAHEIQPETQSERQALTDTGLMLRNLYTDDLFPQLQTLKLKHMKSIKCVTQPKFVLDFPNMQQLIVLSSPFLELSLGNNSLPKLVQIKAEEKWFKELEFEDRQTKISLQDKFTDISTAVQSASEN
ncbi:unnamed protein product [Amaranthus hypochondriacus]